VDKKRRRIDELRRRFAELSAELEKLRAEWLDARNQRDHDKETDLVSAEVALFNEVNMVVKEFGELIGPASEPRQEAREPSTENQTPGQSWKTTHRLRLLLRFDTRVMEVCRKAREGIKTTSYVKLLDSLIGDHERHLTELRTVIEDKGGDVSEPGEPDPKVLRDAFAALAKNISEETRISACIQWEEHGVEAYNEALAERHPPEVLALFGRHCDDGVRHLASIREILGEGKKKTRIVGGTDGP
jgi:rubrerythrin